MSRISVREINSIAKRAARARMGMDAYATAVEEIAAEKGWPAAWREADAVRKLIGDVPKLIAEIRRLQTEATR